MKAKHDDDQSTAGTEQLSQSAETRYRTLFEHAPVGILIADAQKHYLEANASMCRMLGYSRGELVGLQASEIVVHTEIGHIGSALNESKIKSDYNREWQFRHKDGSVFSAEVTTTTMPDGEQLSMVRDITERRQAELVATRLAAIVESSDDAIISKDLNSIITSWNLGAENIFGYSAREMVGTSILRLIPADRRDEEIRILDLIRRGEKLQHFETLRQTRDKRVIDVSITASPIRDATGKVVGVSKIARDITALKTHEREIARMTRLYAALSQINQAIVWTKTRDELLEKICQVLIEHGGFLMAWIGWLNPETQQIVPMAVCGDASGYIRSIKVYADDRPEGRGPSGTSFRSGRPYICNDLMNDPSMLPWRAQIVRHGFRACAVFPIRINDRVCGTLNVYADQQDFFRDKEIALLQEAAGDISFALDNLAREAERRQAEVAAQSERLFSDTMIESMPGILYFYNEQGRFLRWNRNFEIVSGYSAAEIQRMHPLDFFPDEEQPSLERKIAEVFEKGESFIEASLVAKDGKFAPHFFTGRRVEFNGMSCLVGMGIDISERKRAEAALRASELRYHSLFENMLEGYAYCGTFFEQDVLSDFVYLEVNDAFGRLTGLKDVVGKKIGDIIPGVQKDNPEIFEIYGRVALTGRAEKFETYLPALGAWLSITVYSSERGHFVAVFENITERKEAEARIKYLNRVYAMLSSINTLIVRVKERDELFGEACRIAVDKGGFHMAMLCIADPGTKRIVPIATAGKPEELVDAIKGLLSSVELASTTMLARAIKQKQAIISNDSQNDPQVLVGKKYAESGVRSIAVFPLIVSGTAVGAFALYADEIEFFQQEEMQLLTELTSDIAFAINYIEKQERLNYLAYYDVLTGLANRSLFLERAEQYMRGARSGGHRFAIGLIDLERFKNINDSLGRAAGDALLKQVAEWLTRFARDAKLVARLDADHFAFVVPEIKADGNLTGLFDKIAETFLAHPFRVDNIELRLAAKTGIAIYPDDGTDAETVFKNAEAALKSAKKSGDRYLFHTKKMTEAVAAKLTLENQLRQAIDNKEFVLHYQPKVNLKSGKVVGAEALIRWNDPRTGLVPPGKFIPILEETGLISEVGRWALRKAIEDYLRWRAAGLPAVRIAVNVSPMQLRNPDFVAEIARKIGIGEHAAEGLELEITESMIMEDVKWNVSSLRAIRDMGVSIAIDDFGTGFSSLGYLSKLPIDTLKIDRSFVIDMTAGPQGLALVTTIINLAHALKLKVVAEGVETEEQSGLLRLLNCDEMQGYLFSKPVTAELFETRFLT